MSGSKQDNKDNVKARLIRVKALARVEGEGGLHLAMRGDEVEELQLKIYEPPRFFEAFLRGRDFREVPDITARICGICPVAYQMGSCHALEKAMGVFDQLDPAIRQLRNRALLRRVDREPHPAHVSPAPARLPRLRKRHQHGRRPRDSGQALAADQEGGQRGGRPAGRALGASGRRLRRRVLSRARPGGRRRGWPANCGSAWTRCAR